MLAMAQSQHFSALPSVIQSQDPDEVIEKVGAALLPHRMRMLGRMKLAADIRRLDLGPVNIAYVEYGTSVEIEVAADPTAFLVHAAIEGETAINSAEGEYRITPHNLIITAPGSAPTIRMSGECRHFCVRIDADKVRSRAASLGLAGRGDAVLALETGADSSLPAIWRDLVIHISRQAMAIDQLRDADGIRASYAAMLVDLLLRDQEPACVIDGIAPWHVRRACAIIDSDLSETLSISDLASRVGVSVRSLQNGFRQFRGTTPANFIRQRRLLRLHEALQRDQRQCSVTDLMLENGIANFGRFAQYYRQRYGRLPSETLRESRMRQSV